MTEMARFSTAQRVFLFLVIFTGAAVAQDNSFPAWQKGTLDISPWMAGATGEELTNSFTEAQLFSAGVSFGRVMTGEFGRGWRRASLELGFDVIPVFLQTGPQTIYGGGFDPMILRFTSGHRFGRVVPYIEIGGGGFATTSNFPAGNKTSDFNFSARGGGGIHLVTKPRQSLDLGCKWFHLSNANLASFNPEFNGIQFTLGYHWFK
jgi:Lipid A 3-O-deacylase (PagL)